jgi:hypothetical protein
VNLAERNRVAANILREWADTLETDPDATMCVTLAVRYVLAEDYDTFTEPVDGDTITTPVNVLHWPREDHWSEAIELMEDAIGAIQAAEERLTDRPIH